MREQSTSYRDRLNAVLDDGQMKGEYLGGFRVRASENGQSLRIGNDDSGEERGGRTPRSGADGDYFEVFPPPAGPS